MKISMDGFFSELSFVETEANVREVRSMKIKLKVVVAKSFNCIPISIVKGDTVNSIQITS